MMLEYYFLPIGAVGAASLCLCLPNIGESHGVRFGVTGLWSCMAAMFAPVYAPFALVSALIAGAVAYDTLARHFKPKEAATDG